jgi:hypothetical protein
MAILWEEGSMLQRVWKNFLPDLFFLGTVLFLSTIGVVLSLFSSLSKEGETRLFHVQAALTASAPPLLPNLFQLFLIELVQIYQSVVLWLDRQESILTFTDPAATYQNNAVFDLWRVMLTIADSTIGIFIVLAAYQIILSGFSIRYAEALEELPRLIFSAIGANISLLFARFWIDLNNILCAVMLFQVTNHPLSAFSNIVQAVNVTLLIFPLVTLLVFMLIILGIQMTIRLGMILFLIVILPVLFIFLASRHTRHIGQAGIMGYVSAVMVQAIQLTCLVIGVKVLLPFLSLNIDQESALAPLASILASIALIWLTLRIPSILRQWSLQPIADAGGTIEQKLAAVAQALQMALL